MRKPKLRRRLEPVQFLPLVLALLVAGCDHLVEIDAHCDKLCLSSPGPTVPGLATLAAANNPFGGSDASLPSAGGQPADSQPSGPSGASDVVAPTVAASADGGTDGLAGDASIDAEASSPFGNPADGSPAVATDAGAGFGAPDLASPDLDTPDLAASDLPDFDAGLPAAALVWTAQMDFSQVLNQLPATGVGLSAQVRVSKTNLSSATDLSFIDSVDVVLLTGNGPGGSVDAGNPTLALVLDAGAIAGSTGPDGGATLCAGGSGAITIASFRGQAGQLTGPSIDLDILAPDLNLFDCLKSAPATLTVTLRSREGAWPTADAPLTLTTCLAASTQVGWP